MTVSKTKHTYASVWKTLSAIDCSEKAEKKNGLDLPSGRGRGVS
jgi:hypothetical protein